LYLVASNLKLEIKSSSWLKDEDCFMWLDSGESSSKTVLALGKHKEIKARGNEDLKLLQAWLNEHKDWAFGVFSYDLKNQLEELSSDNPSIIDFPDMYFFVPEILLEKDGNTWNIYAQDSKFQVESLVSKISNTKRMPASNQAEFEALESKEEYLNSISKIKDHIQLGDVYELNYCQAYSANSESINVFESFDLLRENIAGPFSSFAFLDGVYVLSSSPERFLKKDADRVFSEPIKGTIARSPDLKVDEQLKAQLESSLKDRSENVMIVDLVRNDLSHIAQKATVEVEELCKVYSFPKVHQMISRVACKMNPELDLMDAIRYCFPMGSMTGAPKIRAMEIIEERESFKRGWFSGSLGYFRPEGDFDFNVLIRTLFVDTKTKTALLPVGGAITILSDSESEYEETLLKSKGIRSLFED